MQISLSLRLRFLVCLIHPLPLLGYEHPIPFNWYQSWDSHLSQRKPILLAICVYQLNWSVRLHCLVSWLFGEGMNPLEMASHFYGEGLNFSSSNFPPKGWEKAQEKEEAKEGEKPQGWTSCFSWRMGGWWSRTKLKLKWWVHKEQHHPHQQGSFIIIQHMLYGRRYE